MHEFLKKPKRHHVREIPLAPILDLLTVVIFFLILSASFIEMRQNTLPPSSTVVAHGSLATPEKIPLNPKLIMGMKDGEVIFLLKWFGATPGQLTKKIKLGKKNYDLNLKSTASLILNEFKKVYPKESKLQLGWQGNINYQVVLTVVDGIIPEIKDLVFLSPEESETLIQKSL